MVALIIAVPILARIRELYRVIVHILRRENQYVGELAGDADTLAAGCICVVDVADFGSGSVVDADVKGVVGALIVGFVFLVLRYVNSTPTAGVSFCQRRGFNWEVKSIL